MMTEKHLTIESQLEKFPSVLPKFIIGLVSFVVFYILTTITISFKGINEKGILIAIAAFKGLFNPSMSVITDLGKYGLLQMLFETLAIAF